MRATALFFALIISILIARNLGPELYGLYTLVNTVISLLAISLHGGGTSFIVRESAQLMLEKRYELFAGLRLRANQWIGFGFLAVVTLLCVATAAYSGERGDLMHYVLVSSPMVFLVSLNKIQVAYLKGLKHPIVSQVPQSVIQPAAQCALLLFFSLYFELSVGAAIASLVVSSSCAVVVGWYLLKRATESITSVNFEFQTIRWLKSLLPFSLIAITVLISNQIMVLIVSILSTTEEVAYLRVADRIAQLISFSLIIVNVVVTPHFAEKSKSGDWEQIETMAKYAGRMAFACALPLALMFTFFGEWIVSIMFGSEYASGASTALLILSVGHLTNVFFGAVTSVLNMSGNEKETFKGMLLGLVATAISGILFVPNMGATGGAIGMSVGFFVWNLYLSRSVVRVLKINITPL